MFLYINRHLSVILELHCRKQLGEKVFKRLLRADNNDKNLEKHLKFSLYTNSFFRN